MGREGELGEEGRAQAGRGTWVPLATQTRHSFLFLTYRTGAGLACHAGHNVAGATRVCMTPHRNH